MINKHVDEIRSFIGCPRTAETCENRKLIDWMHACC